MTKKKATVKKVNHGKATLEFSIENGKIISKIKCTKKVDAEVRAFAQRASDLLAAEFIKRTGCVMVDVDGQLQMATPVSHQLSLPGKWV